MGNRLTSVELAWLGIGHTCTKTLQADVRNADDIRSKS